MKYLKLSFAFLLCVILVTALLSWMMPVKQTVDRSVTISAPAAVVYEQLRKLQYFQQFSAWSLTDSSAKYTLTGTDGTVGASSSWVGDPFLAGEGRIDITALEPGKKVSQVISFNRPKKGKALSVFSLSEQNGVTSVTWHFELGTPRPWNIFNLFSSLDKQMGRDFEKSLNILRDMIQSLPGAVPLKTYEVQSVDLPATSYLEVRQVISKDDITTFFAEHLPLIKQELQKSNQPLGITTGIIYAWDPGSATTDMAVALPVTPGTKNTNPIMQVYELPASKAVQVNYFGVYGKESDVYASIEKYISEKKLNRVYPVLEQYSRGPLNEKDTLKWETKIIVRVE